MMAITYASLNTTVKVSRILKILIVNIVIEISLTDKKITIRRLNYG